MQDPRAHDRAKRLGFGAGVLVLLAGLLVLLSLLRVWKLELDPPRELLWGYHCEAHFRDEPAKAHEARNKAKWQQWSVSEADEYGFWRAQSPAWVWGEYLWFRAFGVGLEQARMFVVVHTIVALALLMWLALVRHGLPAAVGVGLLLGLNWPYLVYSRLALMEGALLCWLVIASVGLSQMERNPARAGRWAAFACVAMAIACTIKQTGLLVLPAFGLVAAYLGLRAAGLVAGLDDRGASWKDWLRARLRGREAKLSIGAVVVLGLALAMLVLSPEYQERLAFNASHFTASYSQPVFGRAVVTLIRGLFSFRLQLMFFSLAPLILWLGSVELGRMVWLGLRDAWARRKGRPLPERRGALEGRADAIDYWMLAWGVLGLLANLASPHRAIRFQLVMLPPAAWLAAALVARVWMHEWSSVALARTARVAMLVLALLGGWMTALRFGEWMRSGEATAAHIGEQLTALIGEREAVVVGEFAAQAVFETNYKHFYVRPNQFNDSPETIRALAITHLAVEGERDFVEEHMTDEVPELLVGRYKLGTIRYRERTLTVWQLATAERRAEVEQWQAQQDARERARQREHDRVEKQQAAKHKLLEKRAAQCLPAAPPEDGVEPFTPLRPLADAQRMRARPGLTVDPVQ